MLQEIWHNNKPTLIQALITLVIFLILSNVAKGIRSDHEVSLQRHEENSLVLSQKLQDLDGLFDVERKSRTALEDRSADLVSKLSISAQPLHPFPKDEDAIATEFKRSKDLVWNDFREKANRLGVMTPSNVPNFDEKSSLTSDQWRDRYLLLEVLDRFLNVLVQVKVTSVDDIAPGNREQETFSDSEKVVARYPIVFSVSCSPAQISELFARFQSDNTFLSIEPDRMKAGSVNPGLLEVVVRVVGLDVEDPREEESGSRRGSIRKRRG